MDTQSALALIDETPDRPPVRADSHGLSQGLQAKYADRITGALHLPGREAVWAPLPADLPAALAAAGRRALDQVLARAGDRTVALDLLAADALVTLALLAQAQKSPERLGEFAAAVLRDVSPAA